jgi:hypothetical protein
LISLAAASLLPLHPEAARPAQAPPARSASIAASPTETSARSRAPAAFERSLLEKYCITCHNERLRTAGLALDRLNPADVGSQAEVWEKIVRKLHLGEMPPPGMPRPDLGASRDFVASVEKALDRAAAVRPDPGRPAIHRLNRTEYANAIRDLLHIDVDARSLLPPDDADQHGFDNMAGVLSVSPAHLERYMLAARKISRLAVGDTAVAVALETYTLPKMLFQDDRQSEDLPFGSRGGLAIRHRFPVDGEYLVKIRLQRQLYDYIRGLGEPHQLEVRLDGARLRLFTVGGEAKGKPAPASFIGTLRGDPEWERYLQTADDDLELRFSAKAGTRTLGVAFLRKTWESEGVLQPRLAGRALELHEMLHGNPAVGSVTIGGPYSVRGPGDPPSRRRIFVCRPRGSEPGEACVRKILSTLARRAYRRAATEEDIQTLLKFYEAGRAGATVEAGLEAALTRLLVDPDFLFRIEREPAGSVSGSAYRLSDVELASRISFFLWSSIPDDELLDKAIQGKLGQPAVLEQQVRRMLADGRAEALVGNFAAQWLQLRKIQVLGPDPELFPDFDENLREAFRRESELFIGSQLREDRSVVELLTANYTFLNERLARHYGVPNVYGSHFRRVVLDDPDRAGLLGHGGILAVTSYPTRTSPVLRGKWILENILGAPPPPPPPDVPGLPDTGEGGRPLSVRQRMEQHRRSPVCASCHVRMDPLGVALENFDAIGRWRAISEAGTAIDALDRLPDGTDIPGARGLRTFLHRRQEQFIRTLTEKLLAFSMGRAVEYYDVPTIRRIVREAAAQDYRWSSLVLGVVRSIPFQMRRSES